MAKAIKTILKLQIPAGKATPAPPIGPALGQHGINIGEFVNKFNAATAQMGDDIISAGIISSPIWAVAALNLFTNSPMLIPCWPKAGPIGGAGVAFPAGICNFNIVFIALAI